LNYKESKMEEQFTKADLKSGMIVKNRKGDTFIVFNNYFADNENKLIGKEGYNLLSNYKNNLLNVAHSDLDIMQIYKPLVEPDVLKFSGVLIWQREEETIESLKNKLKELQNKIDELEGWHNYPEYIPPVDSPIYKRVSIECDVMLNDGTIYKNKPGLNSIFYCVDCNCWEGVEGKVIKWRPSK